MYGLSLAGRITRWPRLDKVWVEVLEVLQASGLDAHLTVQPMGIQPVTIVLADRLDLSDPCMHD